MPLRLDVYQYLECFAYINFSILDFGFWILDLKVFALYAFQRSYK
jgi:hypothetical protein